jgi:sulfur carrier protein ThiS
MVCMSLIGFFVLGGNVMFADGRSVKVIHGANDGEFDLAGSKVSTVRASLVDAFNVPGDALAFVNGNVVPASYRLARNDTLEFVRAIGTKGAGKKNLTEQDLNEMGFAVVGNEAVPIEDGIPDSSWETSRLETYAKGRLASSGQAERQSILQAEKAAVDLYWAGCALKIVRDQKKSEGRGAWTAWLNEKGLAPSTVNDATLLYEHAKTPDALRGLGITVAKERFVRPCKKKAGDDHDAPITTTTSPAKATSGGTVKSPNVKPTVVVDDDVEKDAEDHVELETDDSAVSNLTDTLASELEEIAQRLNEIAQDEMGKVNWNEEKRFENALSAVWTAIDNIYGRINRDLPNS